MREPRRSGPASLAVDFDCARRCQAEFDLEGVHIRFTLGQMLAAVERAHDEAHAADPVRVFRHGSDAAIVVRADVLERAA